MTVENNVFTIKTKRKEHPNAVKYAGRPTMEFGHAFRNFLSDLNAIGPKCAEEFIEGKYVFEEEISAEFFDSILVGDVVGIGLANGFNEIGENFHKQPATYKFKILDVDKNRDIMKARNVTFEHEKSKHKGSEVELTFEDLSVALGMGFGEILERDGKPYGVSEEIEMQVKIVNMSGSADDPNNVITTPTTGNNNATTCIDEEKKSDSNTDTSS